MSIREGIAEIARCGDWCVVERCKIYKDDCGLCVADQILSAIKAEIEKMENPYTSPFTLRKEGYDDALQDILKLLEEK